MKRAGGFYRAGIAALILSGALLIAAFTVPAAYLERMTQEIAAEIGRARQAVLEGDVELALKHVLNAKGALQRRRDAAKLFLNHSALEELQRAIMTAEDLAALEQSDNLITELDQAMSTAERIADAERFNLYNVF